MYKIVKTDEKGGKRVVFDSSKDFSSSKMPNSSKIFGAENVYRGLSSAFNFVASIIPRLSGYNAAIKTGYFMNEEQTNKIFETADSLPSPKRENMLEDLKRNGYGRYNLMSDGNVLRVENCGYGALGCIAGFLTLGVAGGAIGMVALPRLYNMVIIGEAKAKKRQTPVQIAAKYQATPKI